MIYCGIRDTIQLNDAKKKRLVDLTLWVDRPGYPLEDISSMNITKSDADVVIYNNKGLTELARSLSVFDFK